MAELVHSWNWHLIQHSRVDHCRAHSPPWNDGPSPTRAGRSGGPRQACNWFGPAPTHLPPSHNQGNLPAAPIHAPLPPSDGGGELWDQRLPHPQKRHSSSERVGHSAGPRGVGEATRIQAQQVPTRRGKTKCGREREWFWSDSIRGWPENMRGDELGTEDGAPVNRDACSCVQLGVAGRPGGGEAEHGWGIWADPTTSRPTHGAPTAKAVTPSFREVNEVVCP